MEKLDFTSKNVINCVHNEPALWDTECTDVHHEILHVTTHIIISFNSGNKAHKHKTGITHKNIRQKHIKTGT